jgi:uncharacterized protein
MPTEGLLKLFARSPISPLQAHMQEVNACVQLLINFFNASQQNDWELATNIRYKINEIEEKADQLKMDFRAHLPASLLLPVPRLDLLQLVETQDKIANIAKDISGIILGRKMYIPEQLQTQFLTYLTTSCAASEQAKQAIDDLDVLLESGFKGKAVSLVDEMITKLNRIEKESDNQQIEVRQKLFSLESEMSPVDVMFIYKIIHWVGDLADTAQHVGSRLKMMVAK